VSEGDNLARIARVLRGALVGQEVLAARGRAGGAQLERVVGRGVEKVESRGKHLLIIFSGGLTLHSHLAMNGSWHRYRRGEPWRRSAARAVAVLETARAVAVCFDAPTVELLDSRALALHPILARLGPDVAAADFDASAAVGRIRSSAPPGSAARRGRDRQRTTRDDRLTGRRRTLRLRPHQPSVPPLRHAHPLGDAWDAGAARLLVPHLPAPATRSAPGCRCVSHVIHCTASWQR
jgi:hypothetical protein